MEHLKFIPCLLACFLLFLTLSVHVAEATNCATWESLCTDFGWSGGRGTGGYCSATDCCDNPQIECNGSDEITEINFSNKPLGGELTSRISEMTQLEVLSCVSCQLGGAIPEEVWALPNLTKFRVAGDNSLTGSIPPPDSDSIEIINLNGNDLSGELPSLADAPNVRILNLNFNSLHGNIPTGYLDLAWDEFKIRDNSICGSHDPEDEMISHISDIILSGSPADPSGTIQIDGTCIVQENTEACLQDSTCQHEAGGCNPDPEPPAGSCITNCCLANLAPQNAPMCDNYCFFE